MQFQEDFEGSAKFNPLSRCITIASACNVYYRKMCLIENTIASELIRDWHGKGKPIRKQRLGDCIGKNMV